MDYLDQVYVHLKKLKPGKYRMADLADPDRFIDAVQYLISGEWITDVEFTEDDQDLVKHDLTGFKK